jgi:Ca-activated chloride channel family protein
MLEFVHPLLLLPALAVPPLVWWWLRQRRGALRYPQTGLLAGLPPGRSRLARWGGAGLRATALLLGIAALAQPRWPDLRTRIPTEGIAIQMLVDVSGSMAEPDFKWNNQPVSRLEAVKRAFHLFVVGGDADNGEHLEGRPDDQIGLITFATLPESPCPLTLSHSVLVQLLDEQEPKRIPTECRTNIGDAIAWGLHRLEKAQAQRKIIILLSDGEHNIPPPALTPRQAAQLAANQGVIIYTIDAGGEVSTAEALEGAPADSDSAPTAAELRASGKKALQAVAEITGGRYFEARDAASLLGVCQDIDRLERQPIISFQYRRYYDGFAWFGLGSLVLLVGAYVLETTVWQRLP